MRTLRNVVIAIGLVAVAAACGGKKSESTVPDNAATEGSEDGGAEYGDMGGGDPCAAAEGDACAGGEGM
jgi:hypothetical protein